MARNEAIRPFSRMCVRVVLALCFLNEEVIAYAGAETTVFGLDITTGSTGFYRVYG